MEWWAGGPKGVSLGLGAGQGSGSGVGLRLDARGFRSNNLGFNSIWLCPSVGSMEWIRCVLVCVCFAQVFLCVCGLGVREIKFYNYSQVLQKAHLLNREWGVKRERGQKDDKCIFDGSV